MITHMKHIGIGVEASTAFGRQIMRGVMRYANIHRRWVLAEEFHIHSTDPNSWPHCDGAIITEGKSDRIMAMQSRCGIIISCSGGAFVPGVPSVAVDDFAIGRTAAEHLLECRLSNFAIYSWPRETHTVANNRIKGFEDALLESGHSSTVCPVPFDWSRQLDSRSGLHWPQLVAWLKTQPKPLGIFALDDMIAHDLAGACLEAGIDVPDQVAIIGVNNDDLLCESSWPPLSSVQCDFQRVGYLAAELMDRLLSGKAILPEEQMIRLKPVGVVRRLSSDILAVDDPNLAAAMRYIREHCCDPCSVDDILREIPVGRRRLERLFLEQIGRSPYAEITRARMKRAEELLSKSDMNILDVARLCGFADTPNFNRQFKQLLNETPASYRRSRKAN